MTISFNIRVEFYEDHWQVYKHVPSEEKTDRKGRVWVQKHGMGTDTKLGNIWVVNYQEGTFEAEDILNDKRIFQTMEESLAYLISPKSQA